MLKGFILELRYQTTDSDMVLNWGGRSIEVDDVKQSNQKSTIFRKFIARLVLYKNKHVILQITL